MLENRIFSCYRGKIMEKKKLFRSRNERILLGVCGGLGEYFDIDPVIVRIFWVFITIFGGILPGVIVYLLGGLLIPLEPEKPRTMEAHVSYH